MIDIIIFIETQGISYKKKKNMKYTYSLVNWSQDHGIFLTLQLLLAKYDSILNIHIEKSIKSSEKK
jgi:hypothetical protein